MDWKILKEKIYYEDGSFRDILIKDTTVQDWSLWINFVNANYRVRIDNYKTVEDYGQIDLNKVTELWDDEELECFYATIFVGNAEVNVHFFGSTDIENDILPKEISSIEDHEQIVAYMMGISKALNKEVILTPDNTADEPLITVRQNEVFILN
jgi:hypothetical protein